MFRPRKPDDCGKRVENVEKLLNDMLRESERMARLPYVSDADIVAFADAISKFADAFETKKCQQHCSAAGVGRS